MGFNVRRKRESLRIREPRALQRHGGIAMAYVELEVNWTGKVKGGNVTNRLLGGTSKDISAAGDAWVVLDLPPY